MCLFFFFFKQKTAYEMRISDWSSDVCSSDLFGHLKSVYTDYAGDIATAARHLRTLIDDVFDVAAIESGTVSLLIENVDLTTLAEEARAIVSQRAAARDRKSTRLNSSH